MRSLTLPLAALLLAAPAPALAPAPGGIDLAGMARQVAPGDDFFRHANGAWLDATAIPGDMASYGTGAMLVELTLKRNRALVEEARTARPGSEARKIGDFYAAFMDEAAIEQRGLAPVKPFLDEVAAIGDVLGLSGVLGSTLRADVDVLNATRLETPHLLGLWVAQDLDDPSRYSPFLLQGGLTMPSRDYYLDGSGSMKAARAKCLAHMEAMLALAKVADPAGTAARVMALETKIAAAHATHLDTEDVRKGNNHWSRADFDAKAPGMEWRAFFRIAGLAKQDTFVVWQPGALKGLSALVASEPLADWKAWLTFHALDDAAGVLPKAFAEEAFAFHGRILAGTPEMPARWKRGVDAASEALGEALGKLYVARHFPASEKKRAEAMVKNILQAFARRIDALDWMAPATKAEAKRKIKALKVGVGYPDTWRSYEGLQVDPADAYGNARRAALFEYRRNLAKLGSPVDRGEWVMTPQTVNAVNLPAMNAMNFPAAILQPPYFDPRQTAAMAYGATGATIGHEVSHSFDDQGALFDARGRLRNWWSDADFAHFKAAGAKLAAQFDAYRPLPDLHVNGKLTLSENIADLAGLAAAFDAYRLALKGRPAPKVQGFTGDQQFFLSYGQSWREKRREPALRRQVLTDGHAPEEFRADIVRNLDAWYEAFTVKPGQKLHLAPGERVRIW
ncbi:MAG TPA: M13 family metallopeptidase [Holophaga sp.]|nr:M13 family metallopeptidase [Holophaga sp.]